MAVSLTKSERYRENYTIRKIASEWSTHRTLLKIGATVLDNPYLMSKCQHQDLWISEGYPALSMPNINVTRTRLYSLALSCDSMFMRPLSLRARHDIALQKQMQPLFERLGISTNTQVKRHIENIYRGGSYCTNISLTEAKLVSKLVIATNKCITSATPTDMADTYAVLYTTKHRLTQNIKYASEYIPEAGYVYKTGIGHTPKAAKQNHNNSIGRLTTKELNR